eukprot:Skav223618  [mRNA]  locus=scaffold1949:41695:47031:- [translate_table: standard]
MPAVSKSLMDFTRAAAVLSSNCEANSCGAKQCWNMASHLYDRQFSSICRNGEDDARLGTSRTVDARAQWEQQHRLNSMMHPVRAKKVAQPGEVAPRPVEAEKPRFIGDISQDVQQKAVQVLERQVEEREKLASSAVIMAVHFYDRQFSICRSGQEDSRLGASKTVEGRAQYEQQHRMNSMLYPPRAKKVAQPEARGNGIEHLGKRQCSKH